MSTSAEHPEILRFDTADRMRKALRISGVGAAEMSEYLGVSRNTVSNWINGHTPASTQTKRLWALRTGVPFNWLDGGEVTPADDLTHATTDRYSVKVVTLRELKRIHELPAHSVQVAA